MDIILKKDISGLGYKDELITVKNGYATNYLIPKGIAIRATDGEKKMLTETMKQRAFKEERIKKDAEKLAESLKTINVKIGAKAASTGKIFGSVNAIQIAEAIKKQFNFEVDRKMISVDGEAIKELGKYSAKIKLYKEIALDLEFEVIAD